MHNHQEPPPRYGTRKNPKTGAVETYELPPEVDLAKSRKELADVLHGGGWFEDPLAKKTEPEEPAKEPKGAVDEPVYIWTPLGPVVQSMGARPNLEKLGFVEDPPGSGIWRKP